LIAVTLAAASLAQAPADVASESASTLVTVPALTPVIVRIDAELSSRTSKSGDRFNIIVAEDVRIGEAVVIPAGAVGEGEVIHAARRGAGGKAGELIVMARFVLVGENQIRLRSFALGAAGQDMSVDSMAASLAFGPFGLIQKGGDAFIHQNTVGTAKTALEFKLPAVVAPATMLAPPSQFVETKQGEE